MRCEGGVLRETEVYAFLAAVFRDVFRRDDLALSPELSAAGVEGWDSLKQFEIILALEEGLGVSFTSAEVGALERVADLARLVAAKTSG
jgi:acyl carrier protein